MIFLLLAHLWKLLFLSAWLYLSNHAIISCIMWFPRFLIALVGWFCTITNHHIFHYDVHRHVVPHSWPHIYSRLSMYVYMYNHRVLYQRRVSFICQHSLILLSRNVAVNPGPLRLCPANCRSVRYKVPLLAEEKKLNVVEWMSLV